MLTHTIKNYLDNHHVNYQYLSHPTAYTASQVAQAAHIKGKNFIKCVVVNVDKELAMVAMPANTRLNLDTLRKVANASHVGIAREYEFQDVFDDCEVGAMPPFAELYNMDLYLADSLSHQPYLACQAGSHHELLKIARDDFLRMTHPRILPNC